MKARIIVAVICVPALLAVIFLLPVWAFGILIGIIAAIAAVEFIMATKAAGNIRVVAYGAVSAFAIPFSASFDFNTVTGSFIALILLLALFVEAIAAYGTRRPFHLAQIGLIFLGGAVFPMMLGSLVTLRAIPQGMAAGGGGSYFDGRAYVMIPIVIAFLSDGGAYFVGRAFGKHKLIEKISPNKTIEGSVGGLVIALLAMMVFCLIMVIAFEASYNLLLVCVYALGGSVITQLGDLAFSMIKREFDKKDFGNLLPGHGGMLDRFDSMILLAPFVLAMVLWLPVFTLG